MGLFNLIFRLGTDNRDFNRGMQDARRNVNRSADEMSGSFMSAGSKMKGALLGATAAIFSAHRLKEAADYADKIQDLSEQLSISTTTLQELDFVASQSGTTLEGFTSALRRLSVARNAALSDPTGEEAQAFQRLGVGMETLKSARLEDLLNVISESFRSMGDNQVFMADALKLMGRSASETFGAMQSGLTEMRKAAEESGIIVSPETIARVAKYKDEWVTFGSKLRSVFVGVVGIVAELHQGLAEAFDRAGALLSLAGRLLPFAKDHITLKEFGQEVALRQRSKFAADEERRTGQSFGRDHASLEARAARQAEKAQREAHMAQQDRILEQEARVRLINKEQRLDQLRMSPQEWLSHLESQLVEMVRGFGGGPMTAKQRESMTDKEIQIEEAMGSITKPEKPKSGSRMSGDALLSVGNFLGSAPDAQARARAEENVRLLRAIEEHTRGLTNSTIITE